jgi:hypothetical protein
MPAIAGDGNYPVSAIPAGLLKNANVVKRFEEYKFTLKSTSRANLYHHYILTVLNEKGDKFAQATAGYDRLQSIDYIDGNLYDADGKKIKSLKKTEIKDYSGTGEGTLADDNRIKFHSFFYKVYPYTVEYEVSLDFNYTMFFPVWIPVNDEFVAVEYSKMQVVCPANYILRYKSFNYPQEPVTVSEKSGKSYAWEVRKLPATENEYASPHRTEITPCVYLGPTLFEVQGYSGDMESWQDFGKFIYALKSNRDQLPDNIKQTVHQLTDGITDPKQKIAKLYKFMQDNTRYISIQLGIGGWQPFDAAYVATHKYGDCKALTNYMYSLLKEAGIRSNYTLIKAGRGNNFFVKDFPSSQFNHVILSVPLKQDTVWLECTNQILPSGYLSGFTSDRYALAVDENGGKLVRTPNYGLKDNLEIRRTRAGLQDDGSIKMEVITDYKAVQQDDLFGKIHSLSKEKVMDGLKEEIDLPQYDVLKYDYKISTSDLPVVTETLQLTAENYAQVTGKRLFIAPNILTKTHRKLIPDDSRKYDVQLSFAFTDIDTTEITLPPGYQPEALPAPVSIDTKFGRFSSSVKVERDKIIYYRRLENFSGRFPPTAYNDLVKFRETVYKADRAKAVFVKKEG